MAVVFWGGVQGYQSGYYVKLPLKFRQAYEQLPVAGPHAAAPAGRGGRSTPAQAVEAGSCRKSR